MAKQIKAIKCPQCGSSLNTQIGEDRYKCTSCGTEYFLDNDDVNINVNHRYNSNRESADYSQIFKVVGAVIGAIVVFSIITSTCSRLFRKTSSTPTYNVYSGASEKDDEDNKNTFKDSYEYSFVFENSSKDIMALGITEREYGSYSSKDSRNGFYIVFKNLLTGKIVKESKLDIKDLKDKDSRTFIDGKTYIIINKRTLYVVNKDNLSLDDVTESTFKKRQEFSSGVASIEFVYEDRGNGFHIMSNLGKEYFYYPLVDKVYNEDTYYNACIGFNTLLPGAKDVTYYAATRKSDDFKDEPIQILRVIYKSNNGGPEDIEDNPSWFKDFGGSGIFTDRSPYTKQLFRKEYDRVISYADITPGRIYFDAYIKYFDDKAVIISFRPTVAEDAPHILQCLDANTAEIKWTLNIEDKDITRGTLTATSHGYIGKTSTNRYILISTDGKIGKEFTL